MSKRYKKLLACRNSSSSTQLIRYSPTPESPPGNILPLITGSDTTDEVFTRQNEVRLVTQKHLKTKDQDQKTCPTNSLTVPGGRNVNHLKCRLDRSVSSLVEQSYGSCTFFNSRSRLSSSPMPHKRCNHHYANMKEIHQNHDGFQNKPRSKSYTRFEPKPEKSCSRYLRRTMSRPRYELDANIAPNTWSADANRVGRMNTRLLDAIQYQDNIEVQSLLQTGANANATCRAGHISACHAAASDNSEALRLLLQHGADRDRRDKFGRTPLHLAAWAGDTLAIAMILDFPTELQNKILQRVTSEAEDEIKQMRGRLTSKIEVPCELPIISVLSQNWKDSIEHRCRNYMTHLPKFFSGWTPLHIASYGAHHGAVRLLLAAGANPNSKDAIGRTPLDIAGAACYVDPIKVDIAEYLQTIRTLISFGCKLNVSDNTPTESALHTAVEMGSVDAIQMLLDVGAPIWHQNDRGNTPLHKCVENLDQESLQVLANHQVSAQSFRTIDVVNSSGQTVLHAAILASWVPGVCVALDAGAVVTRETCDGKTAIHLAALQGDLDILDEILFNAAQYGNAINYDNGRAEPPIFCAIRSGNLESVRALIDAGAELKISYYTEPNFGDTTMEPYLLSIAPTDLNILNMIIHATAEAGSAEMLQLLLDHDKSLENLLCYKCHYLMNMIPVEFAAFHGKFHTFKFLLQKTIELENKMNQRFDHSRLLLIIATQNRENFLDDLLKQIPDAITAAIGKGFYPLHVAIRNGHRNIIMQLIHNGADLSETDETGTTAISSIIDNISKPTEFLETIFDDYIKTSSNTSGTDCEIFIDYRVLIPDSVKSLENEGQMRVLTALLKNKNRNYQRKLLAHPLVESFLDLKWKTLTAYFTLMVFLYLLFVISLSAYTLSIYYYRDKHNKTTSVYLDVPKIWNPEFWLYCVYVTLGIVIIQELSCTNLLPKTWLRRCYSKEFWVKLVAFILAIITVQVISLDYKMIDGHIDVRRHLATVTLAMAWSTIMMLLSKTPTAGYYMQMFWEVSSKIIKILITFLFLILMFASCFMIQFHSQEPFEGPWASVVKTLVMMTSEFDYSSTFTRNTAKGLSTSIQILRIVFIVFLILTAIVLMNLTIGVAVHDVRNLLHYSNLKRLDKQVGFLNRLEVSRGKKSFFHFLGLHRWFNCKKVPQTMKIMPVNDGKCVYSTRIKEALIDKADGHLYRMGREAESNKIELHLERISKSLNVLQNTRLRIEDIEQCIYYPIHEIKRCLRLSQNTSVATKDRNNQK